MKFFRYCIVYQSTKLSSRGSTSCAFSSVGLHPALPGGILLQSFPPSRRTSDFASEYQTGLLLLHRQRPVTQLARPIEGSVLSLFLCRSIVVIIQKQTILPPASGQPSAASRLNGRKQLSLFSLSNFTVQFWPRLGFRSRFRHLPGVGVQWKSRSSLATAPDRPDGRFRKIPQPGTAPQQRVGHRPFPQSEACRF